MSKQIIMEYVPKLLPMWYEVGFQNIAKHKNFRFADNKLPDYGGIGIDIILEGDELKREVVKHAADQTSFKADACVLPFIPANTVKTLNDPCLEPLREKKADIKKFCVRLECLRKSVNSRGRERYKNEILSLYKKIKRMSTVGKFEKILVPEYIVQLANEFPQQILAPDINFSYAGGCLATSKTLDNKHVLLYSTGRKLDKLALTTLQENDEPGKYLKAVESEKFDIKLKGGNIFQVVCNLNGICYVRQRDRCHFVNFINPLNVSHNECLKKSGLLYVSPSPYIPEDLLCISKSGELALYNAETRQTLWVSNNSFREDVLQTDFWSCNFGSHPKSVLCLNEKRLLSFDLRCEKSVSSEIFSSNHSSCFMNEKLLIMKELKVNSFQHLITSDYHLFVTDERYPKKPVMFWNHALKDYPIYCDVTTYQTTAASSDALILLGTQETREVVAFFLKSSHLQVHPESLGPPLLLSSPSDCIDSLKFHCIGIEDSIVKRFTYPLTGLCSVPHNQKCAFTAFQLTSLGDLFYQDFKKVDSDSGNNSLERTYRFGMGCVLSPPEKISPYLMNWINSIDIFQKDTSINDELTHVNVDLTDLLNIPDEISANCVLCRCSNSHRDKSLVTLEPCPSCGLSDAYSQRLSEASTNLNVLIGPVENIELDNFDVVDLSQFTDPFSKRMLDVWLGADNETALQDVSMEPGASPSSLKSFSDVPTPAWNCDNFVSLSMTSNATSMTIIQPSSSQNTSANFFSSQDTTDEIVPPSQDVRPLIGETLRTPRKSKLMSKKRIVSTGGF